MKLSLGCRRKGTRGSNTNTGGKERPDPLLSLGALDFMPISPSRVIRENHIRQIITKNSRRNNHKMKSFSVLVVYEIRYRR
jgi:hypothetical protein